MENICEWVNCKRIGKFKAPLERDNSKNYKWLCQGHIKLFNKKIASETTTPNLTLPLFVSYEANGWTMGKNSLINNVAQKAGFETI